MSDIAAFLIAGIVALALGAPGWAWIALFALAGFCILAELGSNN